MSRESRHKAFVARQRRMEQIKANTALQPAPKPKPSPKPKRLPWHERWRVVIRTGETSTVVACVVGAVSVGSDPFYFVPLLVAAMVVSCIAVLTEPSFSRLRRILCSAAVVAVLSAVGGAIFYHQRAIAVENPLAEQSLPGFWATFGIKILNAAAARRQYIFSYATPEGAKAELYFSANDIFIFSVTDTHGEIHSIEVPLGASGIPLAKGIYLTCEAGVTSNSTHLRVLVDGKEVQQSSLNYRADLGSRDWRFGALGADSGGHNSGAFLITSMMIGHVTITNSQAEALTNSLRANNPDP